MIRKSITRARAALADLAADLAWLGRDLAADLAQLATDVRADLAGAR